MKAKTKTIFIATVAVLDCVFGGLVVSNSINTSRITDADVKASANYVVGRSINSFNEEIIDSVKDKEAPVIKNVKDITITAGQKVDFFKDVTITDNSKEEIEKKVTGDYDINKVGVYNLTYEIKDSSNNITTENFKLIVKAAPDSEKPKISGVKNITTTVGEKVDLYKNIKVTDNKTASNKITKKIVGSYDLNKAGTYSLAYQVTDEAGNTTTSSKFNLVVKNKTSNNTATSSKTTTNNWKGKKLSRSAGAIKGPSGKETYYNLNMNGCVRIMRRLGYSEAKYPYWVRSDGVKMLGDYVMVAASLDIRPKGSLVQTSLGMGIVVDTGTFAKKNKTQLDIAVTW